MNGRDLKPKEPGPKRELALLSGIWLIVGLFKTMIPPGEEIAADARNFR